MILVSSFSSTSATVSVCLYLVIRQGGAEVVGVEVSTGLHVGDADGLTTPDSHPALTWTVWLPTDLPITVGIVCVVHSSYRLLSTAYTHTHRHTQV